MYTNYLSAFEKVFYEILTEIRPVKKKLFANQRWPPFRVSVNWREYCVCFWLRKGSSIKCVRNWWGDSGGHPNCVKLRIGGRECHASCVNIRLHYLFSWFLQDFCLIVSCFTCRNLTLSLIKKDVFIRKGYFFPTR